MPPVLLSRTLDPLLGIFTGAFAYYLYETNLRTAPAPEQKLANLVHWKIEKYRNNRAERNVAGASSDADLSRVFAQLKDE
ncbi:hypothetical protein F5148DRAFT_996372 [Russula earlei]|uniref:Uncharacterized protein n=1 Tax=Russula earlei TaxID=71964 RepID=A0ACC0UDR4_9AGAM|nr:hypothetical protein F5148DRAFT_996372 [Russula earlei]